MKTQRKPTSTPGAPAGLSAAAAKWWADLQRDFPLADAAGLLLLEQAMRAFDRCEEARAMLDKDGGIITDRFGQKVPHPAIKLERDSRHQLLQCLRALNLDVEPARPPGRPSGH